MFHVRSFRDIAHTEQQREMRGDYFRMRKVMFPTKVLDSRELVRGKFWITYRVQKAHMVAENAAVLESNPASNFPLILVCVKIPGLSSPDSWISRGHVSLLRSNHR